MRCLILDTDYPEFLYDFYARQPALAQASFAEQQAARAASLHGMADFYVSRLRTLGYEAHGLWLNNEWMQKAWAREHGMLFDVPFLPEQAPQASLAMRAALTPLRYLKPLLPVLSYARRRWQAAPRWINEILLQQIKHYRPDVLLVQAMGNLSAAFLREAKAHVRLLAGQHAASALSKFDDFSPYDVVFSSFPPTLDFFAARGIPAELNRLAFEPRVLQALAATEAASPIPISFVGSFYGVHSSRIVWLEKLCARFPQLRVWGAGVESLPASSAIRRAYAGRAWGIEMYRVLQASRITLNHHGDVAPFANNMRLYEATGTGTLLLTEWKENLSELFAPDREVAAYRNVDEACEQIEFYLRDEAARAAVAQAGQMHTLRQHTYEQRVRELVALIERYL